MFNVLHKAKHTKNEYSTQIETHTDKNILFKATLVKVESKKKNI